MGIIKNMKNEIGFTSLCLLYLLFALCVFFIFFLFFIFFIFFTTFLETSQKKDYLKSNDE